MDANAYDVLNAVCLKKMATRKGVAGATGRSEAETAGVLEGLVSEGLLVDVGGHVLPNDTALPALETEAADRYAGARADPAVSEAADRFEPVNRGFLEAMSAWQLVRVGDRSVPNDHTDPVYDEKVITKIERLIDRLDPILSAFEAHDQRFGNYRPRFEGAMDEIARGRTDFVSLPTVDSVHNVWFELHEDLLRTLGRQRAE